jgi:MFS superfamily sulfate permease-like transporter
LELSSCQFLHAGALEVITKMQSELAANGQELVVDGATGQVERLIELARAISPEPKPHETST